MTGSKKNIKLLTKSFSTLSLKPYLGTTSMPDPVLGQVLLSLPKQWTQLRRVNKQFKRVIDEQIYSTYLNSAAAQVDIRMPIRSEKDKQTLFEQQQMEIDFLLQNKKQMLTERRLDRLQALFLLLETLPTQCSVFSLYVRHNVLNKINMFIIHCNIDASTGCHALEYITKLSCSYQRITRFPVALFHIPELQSYWEKLAEMRLDHNNLTSLPDLSHLKALRTLDFSHNNMVAFPKGCDTLPLVTLSASHNKIKEIPVAVGTQPELDLFDVHFNHLSAIPDEIPDEVLYSFDGDDYTELTKESVLKLQYRENIRSIPTLR